VEFSLKDKKPKVAMVDLVFPFLSVHRVKSAIADAMAGESPSAKHGLPLNDCFFGGSHKNSTEYITEFLITKLTVEFTPHFVPNI
jgi:hypothetical protein